MAEPERKLFRLKAEEIQSIASGYGACFASDMITVDGHKVGYMYREAPDFPEDGGWRFLSGNESDEYMDEADNHGVYDCNTIANYDPEIVSLLDAPVGSKFARLNGGPLVRVEDSDPQ